MNKCERCNGKAYGALCGQCETEVGLTDRIAELETKNKYYKSVICDRCANERTSEICHECPYRKE